MQLLDLLTGEPWAIHEEYLDRIAAIANRHLEGSPLTAAELEAISSQTGQPLDNTHGVELLEGGVARIGLRGPIFPRANMMTRCSGATSAETLISDVRAAFDNPSVRGILLDVDSPGGRVTGIHEASSTIRELRALEEKPIVAHVDGMDASAAYWITSACDAIFAAPTSMIGSIGALCELSPPEKGGKSLKVVSHRAPLKAQDPHTKEGRARLQDMVNAAEEVFFEGVSQNRGVSVETVAAQYGQGAVLTAKAALEAGMIDGLLTQNEAIALLRAAFHH